MLERVGGVQRGGAKHRLEFVSLFTGALSEKTVTHESKLLKVNLDESCDIKSGRGPCSAAVSAYVHRSRLGGDNVLDRILRQVV